MRRDNDDTQYRCILLLLYPYIYTTYVQISHFLNNIKKNAAYTHILRITRHTLPPPSPSVCLSLSLSLCLSPVTSPPPNAKKKKNRTQPRKKVKNKQNPRGTQKHTKHTHHPLPGYEAKTKWILCSPKQKWIFRDSSPPSLFLFSPPVCFLAFFLALIVATTSPLSLSLSLSLSHPTSPSSSSSAVHAAIAACVCSRTVWRASPPPPRPTPLHTVLVRFGRKRRRQWSR